MISEKKHFSSYILLAEQISLSGWLPLLCEILGNMFIVIVCWPGWDVINFEINLVFLIKPFFLHDQKFKANNCHILRTEGFKMKWKAFFTIFKGPLLKQIKNLEDESPSLNSHKKSYLKYLQVKVVKKLNGSWKFYRPLKSFSFYFPWQKSVEFAVQKIIAELLLRAESLKVKGLPTSAKPGKVFITKLPFDVLSENVINIVRIWLFLKNKNIFDFFSFFFLFFEMARKIELSVFKSLMP